MAVLSFWLLFLFLLVIDFKSVLAVRWWLGRGDCDIGCNGNDSGGS